jgi:hypothetical protein
MSIPVDLAALETTLQGFGAGYLVTVSPTAAPKVLNIVARVEDGVVVLVAESRGSAANIAVNPVVTLVFPPLEPEGPSLIVDGRAAVVADGFRVTPESAILHVHRK